MDDSEIEVTEGADKRAKNIRLIVPVSCGQESRDLIFKAPDLREVIRRMCLKIMYLETRVHDVEAENTELLALSAKVLAEEDGK